MRKLDYAEPVILRSELCSIGSQQKFIQDGRWFKLDTFGASQGLAEEFVSFIELAISDFKFVNYVSCQVSTPSGVVNACSCRPMFRHRDVSFIPLHTLFLQHENSLALLNSGSDISLRLLNALVQLQEWTGLNLQHYLRDCLFLDSLILNEDRHLRNLGVLYDNRSRQYSVAPVFDNGCSLMQYGHPAGEPFEEEFSKASRSARPFHRDFIKQADALLRIGCQPLVLSRQIIETVLQEYYNPYYSDSRVALCKTVLRRRLSELEGSIFIWG